MWKRILLSSGVAASLATCLIAANSDGRWSNLERVTHKRDYTFVYKDGTCVAGWITSVIQDSVRVRIPLARHISKGATIERATVARITDGGTSAHNAIFSDRSSWGKRESRQS